MVMGVLEVAELSWRVYGVGDGYSVIRNIGPRVKC